ncbi:hypothetical protein BDW60DRAFT_200379 [Aspergillus nidulans var. acristatus]
MTQRGSGEEDGIYYHSSEPIGEVYSLISREDEFDIFFFARIFHGIRMTSLCGINLRAMSATSCIPMLRGRRTSGAMRGILSL